ncbi:hypothetical protein T12_7366 [Trichinella patagoniensis]|uniref:Uncharacterized protein n=1 Tax=Trichinella patagoniensis TaxID=990121 RepID=A0A0V0Z721_9BILA|nr:hypothetical protein T12_7366 [Trichinella patagoniensis]
MCIASRWEAKNYRFRNWVPVQKSLRTTALEVSNPTNSVQIKDFVKILFWFYFFDISQQTSNPELSIFNPLYAVVVE